MDPQQNLTEADTYGWVEKLLSFIIIFTMILAVKIYLFYKE